MNNVTQITNFKESLIEYIDGLIKTMSFHYGPNGKYAVILSDKDILADPIFTTDGFKIFKSFKPSNPVENLILKVFTYIGNRISSQIGDGTTTGILFGLYVMREFLVNDKFFKMFEDKTYYEIKEYLDKILRIFSSYVDDASFTLSKLKKQFPSIDDIKLIKKIAYSQAYTSSHGDIEISEAVSELLTYLPYETLDSIYYEQFDIETSKRINLKIEDSDYECKSDILSSEMFNSDSNTRFKATDAKVLISHVGVNTTDLNYPTVMNEIRSSFDRNEDLVILTASVCGYTRTEIIKTISECKIKNETENKPIPAVGVFFVDTDSEPVNDLVVLSVIAKDEPISYTKLIVHTGVDVVFEGSKLKLEKFNKVKVSESTKLNTRPQFENPSFPVFNSLVQDLNMTIERLRSLDDVENRHSFKLKRYLKIKNRLILNRRAVVEIGGGTYDNNTLFDIVEDCIGSVRKSMKEGFVFGNLYTTIYQMKNTYNEMKSCCNNEGINIILEVFIKALESIKKNDRHSKKHDLWFLDTIKGVSVDINEQSFWEDFEQVIIIQPIKTDLEVIKRVGEALFKLFYTTELITAEA